MTYKRKFILLFNLSAYLAVHSDCCIIHNDKAVAASDMAL